MSNEPTQHILHLTDDEARMMSYTAYREAERYADAYKSQHITLYKRQAEFKRWVQIASDLGFSPPTPGGPGCHRESLTKVYHFGEDYGPFGHFCERLMNHRGRHRCVVCDHQYTNAKPHWSEQ